MDKLAIESVLAAEFSKMKDELPENYNKPAAKPDDTKPESITASAKDLSDQTEAKEESRSESKVDEKLLASDSPSEGNVATAAAAALASAAVKAKVHV